MPVRLSGKDIVKALGKGGWELERVTGSHHVMRHAVRAAYDPAQAPRFRAGHPGAADDHPELPAVGTFRAGPAAEHRFGGTFTKRAAAHPAESEPERFTNPQFAAKPKRPAKPERVVNVAIPEPENTGSDRLRKPAPDKPGCALAHSYSGSLHDPPGHRQQRATGRK